MVGGVTRKEALGADGRGSFTNTDLIGCKEMAMAAA